MAIKVFGHEVSTPEAVAIAGGSGLAIWFAYKQHKASASSASSPTAIDPVTGLPYSQDEQIDPLTGLAYLPEAQQYGSVAAAEQAVAGEAATSLSTADNGSGIIGTSTGTTGTTDTGTTGTTDTSGGTIADVPSSGYTSNAQWAAAVTAGLVDLGYNAADVTAALNAYLANQPETAAQVGIVNTALAEYGPPPIGTFTIVQASATTTSGGGSTKTGPITVTPVDLRTSQVNATSVQVVWAAPTIPSGQGPLTGYTAEVYNANGTSEGSSWTVPKTQLYANAGGLKPKTTYHINVWCEPAQTGGPHASVQFTTT